MTRETHHCLCGHSSDAPGTCPTAACAGTRLHSKREGWKPQPATFHDNPLLGAGDE